MLSRFVIKRYCHSNGRTKCYENLHKIDSMRQELNEIKETIKYYHEPLKIIYCTSIISLSGIIGLLFTK
jgi:hypothetical protein